MAAWLTCPASGNPCPHTGNPCRFGLCLIRDGEPRVRWVSVEALTGSRLPRGWADLEPVPEETPDDE